MCYQSKMDNTLKLINIYISSYYESYFYYHIITFIKLNFLMNILYMLGVCMCMCIY